jgi:ribosomal protein L7/L12
VDSVYQDTVKEIAGAVLGIAKDVVDEAKSALNSDVANDVGDMAEMMGFGDELK